MSTQDPCTRVRSGGGGFKEETPFSSEVRRTSCGHTRHIWAQDPEFGWGAVSTSKESRVCPKLKHFLMTPNKGNNLCRKCRGAWSLEPSAKPHACRVDFLQREGSPVIGISPFSNAQIYSVHCVLPRTQADGRCVVSDDASLPASTDSCEDTTNDRVNRKEAGHCGAVATECAPGDKSQSHRERAWRQVSVTQGARLATSLSHTGSAPGDESQSHRERTHSNMADNTQGKR